MKERKNAYTLKTHSMEKYILLIMQYTYPYSHTNLHIHIIYKFHSITDTHINICKYLHSPHTTHTLIHTMHTYLHTNNTHSMLIFLVYYFITYLIILFSSSEIPQFRLPFGVVDFEINLMKDLGVKVSYIFIFIIYLLYTSTNITFKICDSTNYNIGLQFSTFWFVMHNFCNNMSILLKF